jgi:hypothetical protein
MGGQRGPKQLREEREALLRATEEQAEREAVRLPRRTVLERARLLGYHDDGRDGDVTEWALSVLSVYRVMAHGHRDALGAAHIGHVLNDDGTCRTCAENVDLLHRLQGSFPNV